MGGPPEWCHWNGGGERERERERECVCVSVCVCVCACVRARARQTLPDLLVFIAVCKDGLVFVIVVVILPSFCN